MTENRRHPKNADMLIAAKEESKRRYVHTPHGSVMSVPSMSDEQAVELAADEYPSHSIDEFELVTDLCEHNRPMVSGCLDCGRLPEWDRD